MKIRKRMLTLRFTTISAFIWCLVFVDAIAVTPPTSPVQTVAYEVTSGNAISIEQIDRAIAELEQATDVSAEVKVQAHDNYRAATKNLQSAADSEARNKAIVADAETVGVRSEDLKKQLVDLNGQKPALKSAMPLTEMEQLLPTFELQLSGYKKARQDAEVELSARTPRRKEIRARLVAIQEKNNDAASQLKTLAGAETGALTHSLVARLMTRRLTLEKEKASLEAELVKLDADEAANLVRTRLEVAQANISHTEKLVAILQQQINTTRESVAKEAVRQARREAISADPALKVYAEQNQVLAENAKLIAEALADTNSKLKISTETHENLLRQFAQTKKKVDSVGLTSSVGALLRKQKTTLPDVGSRRAAVADRQKLINDTQYELFEYEEDQQCIDEVDETVSKILALAQQKSPQSAEFLESAARDLLKRRHEYLDDLIRNAGQYFDTLIELDTIDQQIIELESVYENYIDQRVLWIRSGPAFTNGFGIQSSDTWLLSASKWKDAFLNLDSDIKNHSWLYVVCVSLISLLILRTRGVQLKITQIGEAAEKANCRSIAPTLQGLWLTAVVSIGCPLGFVFIGWRLVQSANGSEFASAIGQAFKVVGMLWMCVELIRQTCRRKGIGESHFRWPTASTELLRRELRWFSILGLPTAFITTTLASSDGIHERGDVQRIAFIAAMVLIASLAIRMLRPDGLFREYVAENPNSLASKLKRAFPVLGAALPLSLAALAAAGYFYTAQTLFWRLFSTCTFVATLVLMRSILYRMLLLRRRHLSMEQSRQRAATAQQLEENGGGSLPVAGIIAESKQDDITTHSLQSRNLISTAMTAMSLVGMWMIWIQVLPALSMVGDYPLWGKSDVAAASAAPPVMSPINAVSGGSNSPSPLIEDDTSVGSATISDLACAILIVVVTIVLFRNGPGLLEMSILQQLPLDASVRYAITTLVSYVIVMVGTIATCSTIGLQWSQIQWLATALTFGLAFGLQEMFANFVAGLIILLERPIRVGDIVTVDDVTGVVSRIRIRATSITNWDRKEYVVPNKEFITGRLLNWTLSDKVNRVVVEVGLAYGSDTEQARELLLKAANDHPIILNDPAAVATFEGFGDNSLKLVLRAFLPSLENRLQVIHELHTAIDQAFRKAKLEIAFPQRDLHIRSMTAEPAIDLQVHQEGSAIERSEAA